MNMFASRLVPAMAQRHVRSYATQPAKSSSSLVPLALGAAVLAGGGYYFFSGGKLPDPKDVKKAEDKAAAALGIKTHADAPAALDPKAFKPFKLLKVEHYNHNSSVFHFELPPDHVSGLTVASCVVTRAADDSIKDDKGKPVIRPYTPVSAPDEKGVISFLVKKYEQGKLSKHFFDLKLGDELAIKGPIKKFDYTPNQFERVGIVVGGSGLTPGWQIVQAIDQNPADKTKATLIFSNVTEQDILWRERLDDLKKRKPDQFDIIYTLDKPPKGWTGPSGYITPELLGKSLPPSGFADKIKIFVCGPPGQVAAVAGAKDGFKQGELKGILADLGYSESQVFKF